MRVASVCFALASLAASAAAQTEFHFDLTGDEETPPVTTRATGYGQLILNEDLTVDYFLVTMRVQGTDAGLFLGDLGIDGTILFKLTGGPTIWQGSAGPLGASDLAELLDGHTFVRVLTAAHPGGEMRGQVLPNPTVFGAHLTGGQEVPPVSTAAVGDAAFLINTDRTVTYVVNTTGITGTDAHVNNGAFGAEGSVLFDLVGGPVVWSGTSPVLASTDLALLQLGQMYVNVASAANIDGEIRGQIIPSEVPYGRPAGVTLASLHMTGAPTDFGTISITIANGLPNGFGLIGIAADRGATPAGKGNFYLDAPFSLIPVNLNSGGFFTLTNSLPDITASSSVFLQFAGLDDSTGDIYTSNATEVRIEAF